MEDKTISWYVPGKTLHAINKMDKDYRYTLSAPYGQLPNDFRPLTPMKMLQMGVFEGKYLNDCSSEFPKEWFVRARTVSSPDSSPDISLNYYKVKARQSLNVWRHNGWLYGPDNRGWFQWYCRFYLGRRIPEVDKKQIARWKSFQSRHGAQLRSHLQQGHNVQRLRQALLQWGVKLHSLSL